MNVFDKKVWWLVIALAIPSVSGAQPALHTLLDNGPTAKRMNIVVVAEGYTEAEQADFIEDAQDVLDEFLTTPPYAEYAAFFNAFAITSVSAESGSDHPSEGVLRDTYFHSYYDCHNVQRLICLETEGDARLNAALRDLVPEYDITMVLVNDPEYGGSGGTPAIASVYPLAPDILLHELGHSLVFLDDEYAEGYISIVGNHNTWFAYAHERDEVRWSYWIDSSTPLPTPNTPPYRNVVGTFEIAIYPHGAAVHRPELSCKMRRVVYDFCAVCHERHIGAMYRLVRLIDAHEPLAEVVEITDGTAAVFSVLPLVPEERLAVEWTVNGVPVIGAQGTTLQISASDLEAGENLVAVHVTDTNESVRAPDLLPLLHDSTAWTVVRAEPVGVEPAPFPAAELFAAHPNPVRGMTTLAFYLPTPGPVHLSVYDVTGRRVATVVASFLSAGAHEVEWRTAGLPGVYVYRLDATGLSTSRKLMVLR